MLAKNNVTFYALFSLIFITECWLSPASVCMQLTFEKNPSTIFLFTTRLLLLVILSKKAKNSAGPGARQSATDSAQLVDEITTLYESKPLAFKALYASG